MYEESLVFRVNSTSGGCAGGIEVYTCIETHFILTVIALTPSSAAFLDSLIYSFLSFSLFASSFLSLLLPTFTSACLSPLRLESYWNDAPHKNIHVSLPASSSSCLTSCLLNHWMYLSCVVFSLHCSKFMRSTLLVHLLFTRVFVFESWQYVSSAFNPASLSASAKTNTSWMLYSQLALCETPLLLIFVLFPATLCAASLVVFPQAVSNVHLF